MTVAVAGTVETLLNAVTATGPTTFVDLSAPKAVTIQTVVGGTATTPSVVYNIEVSLDNATWTPLQVHTDTVGSIVQAYIPTRYYRVNIISITNLSTFTLLAETF